MAIIFVKVRNDELKLYDSYIDYWQLIKLSGFETCEVSEVEKDSDNVYIFSPANGTINDWMAHDHRAKYIVWQLERPNINDAKDSLYGMMPPPNCDEVWVSDRALWKAVNDPKCKFVVMGGHKDLGEEHKEPKEVERWDFVHMAYIYGERERKINWIKNQGYKVAAATFENRELSLSSSRFGLCLHQDEFPTIEPLRYVLFACWKLPLVCEKSDDFYPYEIIPFETMPFDKFKYDPEGIAETNYYQMTEEFTFKKCVKNEIDRIAQ